MNNAMTTPLLAKTATKPPASVAAPSPAPTSTATPPPAPSQSSNDIGYRLPENATMQNAMKWAIIEDKPIMLDYWVDSLEKRVLIGMKENKEKLLVKSADEYTSPIAKIFKHNNDYIIMTENSIYLVDANVDVRKLSS